MHLLTALCHLPHLTACLIKQQQLGGIATNYFAIQAEIIQLIVHSVSGVRSSEEQDSQWMWVAKVVQPGQIPNGIVANFSLPCGG